MPALKEGPESGPKSGGKTAHADSECAPVRPWIEGRFADPKKDHKTKTYYDRVGPQRRTWIRHE